MSAYASERSSTVASSNSAERSTSSARTLTAFDGVGHDHERLGGQAVDDQVVQHAAVGVADHRVARPADRELGQIPDERVVERSPGLRAGEEDLPHVGQVEQPGTRADGLVLGGLAAVAQRHQIAGELGDGGAEVLVDLVEWCLLGVRNGHRGRLLIAQALACWRVSIVPLVRGMRSRRLPLCHRCLRASPRQGLAPSAGAWSLRFPEVAWPARYFSPERFRGGVAPSASQAGGQGALPRGINSSGQASSAGPGGRPPGASRCEGPPPSAGWGGGAGFRSRRPDLVDVETG